jgi:hypothetical protein
MLMRAMHVLYACARAKQTTSITFPVRAGGLVVCVTEFRAAVASALALEGIGRLEDIRLDSGSVITTVSCRLDMNMHGSLSSPTPNRTTFHTARATAVAWRHCTVAKVRQGLDDFCQSLSSTPPPPTTHSHAHAHTDTHRHAHARAHTHTL